jgi:hypothetical protein
MLTESIRKDYMKAFGYGKISTDIQLHMSEILLWHSVGVNCLFRILNLALRER